MGGDSGSAASRWVPSPGDVVRVREPSEFIATLAKKIANRDAVVVRCWEVAGYPQQKRARVRFLKRNGRGKEFEESFRSTDLMPWAGKDA